MSDSIPLELAGKAGLREGLDWAVMEDDSGAKVIRYTGIGTAKLVRYFEGEGNDPARARLLRTDLLVNGAFPHGPLPGESV